MKFMLPIICLLSLLHSPMVATASEQQYAIVVHKECPLETLSATELRRIFLGKTKILPDGSTIVPVLNPKTAVHADFTRQLLRKSPRQLNTYWRKNLFSGRSMIPYQATGPADLINYLKKNPNAISYMKKSELDGSLKSLGVTK